MISIKVDSWGSQIKKSLKKVGRGFGKPLARTFFGALIVVV